MRALSLAYHDVLEPGTQAGIPPDVLLYCLDRSEFSAHLESVRRHALGPVRTITGFQPWTDDVPVLLTFDDGGAGMYACALEELEPRGWRGHFFITTEWIGRLGFLSASQIKQMHARGHVIGSHSCSHPARMSRLSFAELRREWQESCARLADIVSAPVRVASVPDGYFSRKVAETAALCGIGALFTSEPSSRVKAVDHCLILGRYTLLRGSSPGLAGSLAEGRVWPRWRQSMFWKAKEIVKASIGQQYLTIRERLLAHGIFGPGK